MDVSSVEGKGTLTGTAARIKIPESEKWILEKPRKEVFIVIDVERKDIWLETVEKKESKKCPKRV
jgi:hypothetical protein